MAQNIYDNPEFFQAFRELKKSSAKKGLQGGSTTLEQLSKILPPLKGLTILDLGCGDGWFSTWAIELGAASTHGIDVSESQLGLAKEATDALNAGDRATWECADLDGVTLKEGTYDLVFSSLALHYVKDLKTVLAKISTSLKPGGSVYFSVEHPIYTACRRRETCEGQDGNWIPHWPVAEYFDEGERTHFWLGKDVEKSHFTLATYVNTVLKSGLTLVHFEEWNRPGNGDFQGQKWWMAAEVGPSFLMLGAKKL
ncbi:methylase [Thozetella sp. PMI_491]|nr:methylase [Thozetella sp. PMI_491]